MKRLFRFTALLLSLSLLLALTACNEEQVISTSYKTLTVASDAYNAALLTAADLDRQGKLTADQKAEVIRIGNQFRLAYQAGASALEAYAVTARADDKAKLNLALTEVTRLVSDLTSLLGPVLTNQTRGGIQS